VQAQARERLGERHQALIVQGHGDEARVQVVAVDVLRPAQVLVDREQPLGPLRRPGHVVQVGRRVAQEVPGRVQEGVGDVGFPARRPAAAGAGGVDERGDRGQRRAARAGRAEVAHVGQEHGQVRLGHGHGAAAPLLTGGYRFAP
jgi:hypothetical protein